MSYLFINIILIRSSFNPWKIASHNIRTTIVNRNKLSRSIFFKGHDLIVSYINSSMVIRSTAIHNDITRLSFSKRDRSAVISKRISVTSLPVFIVEEITVTTESTPVQPSYKRAGISNKRNFVERTKSVVETRPFSRAFRIGDGLIAFHGPFRSSSDCSTRRSNMTWCAFSSLRDKRIWVAAFDWVRYRSSEWWQMIRFGAITDRNSLDSFATI